MELQVQNTASHTLAAAHRDTVNVVASSTVQASLNVDMNSVLGENSVESLAPVVSDFRLEDIDVVYLRTLQPTPAPSKAVVSTEESSDSTAVISASSTATVLLIVLVVTYRMRVAQNNKANSVAPTSASAPGEEVSLAAVVPSSIEDPYPEEEAAEDEVDQAEEIEEGIDEQKPVGIGKEWIRDTDLDSNLEDLVKIHNMDDLENGQKAVQLSSSASYLSLSSDTVGEMDRNNIDQPNLDVMENGYQKTNKIVFGQLSSSSDSLWTLNSDSVEEPIHAPVEGRVPNLQRDYSVLTSSSETMDASEGSEVLNVVIDGNETSKLDYFLAELATTTDEDISCSDSVSL